MRRYADARRIRTTVCPIPFGSLFTPDRYTVGHQVAPLPRSLRDLGRTRQPVNRYRNVVVGCVNYTVVDVEIVIAVHGGANAEGNVNGKLPLIEEAPSRQMGESLLRRVETRFLGRRFF